MTDREKRNLEVSKKQEIEKASGEPTREGVAFVPEVDISESEAGLVLYADMPGVTKDNLDIDIREGVLTVTGTVEPERDNLRLVHGEYEIGGFQRRFTLGEKIDQEQIEAKLENGVLQLTLPKVEAHKPRKITIS